MTKITIIGNNANGLNIFDGGRIKIRLYYKLLQKSGYDVSIIDLFKWHKHFFRVIKNIKTSIKNNDCILIMAGPNGCRFLIPLINFLNKKGHSRTAFIMLGIGSLEKVIQNLNESEVNDFLNCRNFFGIDDSKFAKELKKIDIIVPENEIVAQTYRQFYHLSNVEVLTNFRDAKIETKEYQSSNDLKIIFLSRICEEKGIFDIINSVLELRKQKFDVKLDIYGELQLTSQETINFNSLLSDSIQYKGIIDPNKSIETIKKYDIFCLPTKYVGEGTPGSVIESFISGTPVLISSYSQALNLITDKETGFIFKQGDISNLVGTILFIFKNKNLLKEVGLKAQELSKKYLFSYNKDKFINCILGDKK